MQQGSVSGYSCTRHSNHVRRARYRNVLRHLNAARHGKDRGSWDVVLKQFEGRNGRADPRSSGSQGSSAGWMNISATRKIKVGTAQKQGGKDKGKRRLIKPGCSGGICCPTMIASAKAAPSTRATVAVRINPKMSHRYPVARYASPTHLPRRLSYNVDSSVRECQLRVLGACFAKIHRCNVLGFCQEGILIQCTRVESD